jgi:hypothetical protein
MSALMHMMMENYNELIETKRGEYRGTTKRKLYSWISDPKVDSWLFMHSPVPVVSILLVYLYFVLKLGPQLMEKRKAFDLKRVLIGYNLYQVVFSMWLCCKAITVKSALPHLLNHSCKNPSPDQEFQVAVLVWYHQIHIFSDLSSFSCRTVLGGTSSRKWSSSWTLYSSSSEKNSRK